MNGEHGLVEAAEFADDDAGLREFDAYLGDIPQLPSAVLIDVIEEEFSLDTIPKLNWRDRSALLQRRSQTKFRRTPYRQSQILGKNARNAAEFDVLHSAISNHELLDPWLQIMLRYRTPLTGVFSVPLLAPGVFRRLGTTKRDVLCIASHQGDKLRQVFLSHGHLRSARLTQAPSPDDAAYPQFIVTEAMRAGTPRRSETAPASIGHCAGARRSGRPGAACRAGARQRRGRHGRLRPDDGTCQAQAAAPSKRLQAVCGAAG